MKSKINIYLLTLSVITALFIFLHFSSCTQDDTVLPDTGGTGGNSDTVHLGFNDGRTTFDKAHSNVNWGTPYLGAVGLLTGRFNTFGFNTFNFYADEPDSIYFEAYVYLNSVNTGEPGRDGGCLLGTFGTSAGAGYVDSNLAIIKSKQVAFGTTGNSYTVTADFTFHGVTKELTATLDYVGKTNTGSADVYGLELSFSILAISDFGIQSTSIADKVDIKCSANFKRT